MSATAAATPVTVVPGTSGQGVGAAVHKDLYKAAPDPAAARAEALAKARDLGLAFFAFFSVIIGGLSLGMNGAFTRGHVVVVQAPPGVKAADVKLDAAELVDRWSARWSDGTTTDVVAVDLPDVDDTPPLETLRSCHRVRVQVVDDEGARRFVATTYVTDVPGQRVVGAVLPTGASTRATPSFIHALRTARLAHLVPTHCAITLGAIMGLLGVFVPALLVPFYRFWMAFVAAPLGWFNTRLILGIVFFLLFTPMALFLALRRLISPASDALARADRPGQSYWKPREAARPRDHFERTF